MTKRKSGYLHRRTLLSGSAALSASAIIVCGTGGIAAGQQMMAPLEQNAIYVSWTAVRDFDLAPGCWLARA